MTIDEFLKEAHQGVPEAQYVVALCFANGWGVEADKTVSERWLQKSAERGYAASQYELASLLCEKGEELAIEAIDWLRKSAVQGFPLGEYLYSLYCESGIGMTPDMVDSFRFSLLAAQHGYWPAMRRTASMLEEGVGVTRDSEQAFYWYRKAAELGDADATANVGRMYANGIGVERNNAMAIEWYKKGQERESPWALYALSSVYRFGQLGQSVDVEKADELATEAEELLRKRADRGSSHAALGVEPRVYLGRQ